MNKKVIAIIAGILTVYSLLTGYLGWNVYSWVKMFWTGLDVWVFTAVWFLWAFSFLIGRLGHQWLYFSVAGAYWLAFLQYGLLIMPLADLAFLLAGGDYLFQIGLITACVLLIIFIAGTYGAYSPVIRRRTIEIEGSDRPPLRVVVASDFHLGILSGKRHLRRFTERVNGIQPDLVLLPGDLVDDDPIWFVRYGMDEILKEIKTKYGVYATLGNHDYYGKKIPLLVKEMKRANVRVLQDETVCIDDSFFITGREDLTNRNRKLLDELKPDLDLPWFVMDHTPADLKTPVKLGVDLHLSGHTHRGQMWPNSYFTKKIFELDYGYFKKGKVHFIVSSGFGFWGPPLRVGTRSELWEVTIAFKPKAERGI